MKNFNANPKIYHIHLYPMLSSTSILYADKMLDWGKMVLDYSWCGMVDDDTRIIIVYLIIFLTSIMLRNKFFVQALTWIMRVSPSVMISASSYEQRLNTHIHSRINQTCRWHDLENHARWYKTKNSWIYHSNNYWK